MGVFNVVLCVVAAAAAAAAAAGVLMVSRDDIPALCVEHSVTAVSCAGAVGPDSLLPHPDDCRLFYYCVGASLPPVCRACPAGLHFSPSEHVCDAPAHAGCTVTTTALPPTTSAEPLPTE